jgi:3'-phosphoadenosine 5'-phosphosulfate sulfotransferase (PAPS reductase)/FAD synthetase
MTTTAAQQLTLAAMPGDSAWTATVTGTPAPDLRDYDLLLVGLSGGKDSQATAGVVAEAASAAGVTERMVGVHADLGEEEWAETPAYAARHAAHFGIPRFEIVGRELEDPASGDRRPQSLLEHIAAHGKFPDAARRFCTSDHKTGPIRRLMTALVREVDPVRLGRPVRILDIQGFRAAESPRRRRLPPYCRNEDASNQTRRQVDTWYPIHDWSTPQVRAYCDASGVDHHPAYDDPPGSGNWAGMPRLSCSFCVLAGRDALILAARRRPELAARYALVERQIGHRFKAGLSMAQIIEAAAATPPTATPIQDWQA